MKQLDKVAEMLRAGGWVSTVDFIQNYILRGGAYICLLKKRGWEIDSRTVEGKSYNEYCLVSEPVSISPEPNPVRQDRLFDAPRRRIYY